jgi:hypothetical protein
MKKNLMLLATMALGLTSCAAHRMICLIDESTVAVHCNRQAIEADTDVIYENVQVISASTETIKENDRRLHEAAK